VTVLSEPTITKDSKRMKEFLIIKLCCTSFCEANYQC